MRLQFSDASLWREVLVGASKLVKEITVVPEDSGVRLRSLDPSHVVLVDIFFPRESMEEYESGSEAFGIDLEEFAEIIRRARKDDALTMELKENRLRTVFSGKLRREFIEPTIEASFKDLPEPKIDLKAEVRILPEALKNALEDIEMMGDSLTFEASEDSFRILSESEVGTASVVLTKDGGEIISIQAEEVQKATYGIEYFSELLGQIKRA
ncbi:MAG: hypothetical protein QXP23_02135, partial [Fervidicoccaceae archaeon]